MASEQDIQRVRTSFFRANQLQVFADGELDEHMRKVWQQKANAELSGCVRLARFLGVSDSDIRGHQGGDADGTQTNEKHPC